MRIINEKDVTCSKCGLPLIDGIDGVCRHCRVSDYTPKGRKIGADIEETPHWKDIGAIALGVAVIAALLYFFL